MGAKHFGARVQRLEDPALLTGRGPFVDDVKLPGVLHACFVSSPHAHARLRGIDIKPAMGIPGVHAVLTATCPNRCAASRCRFCCQIQRSWWHARKRDWLETKFIMLASRSRW